MISESGIGDDLVILRDRWYSDKIDYGVKLTNRGGTISAGNQPDIENYRNRKCYYTAYSVLIDWNGDIFLCPQDWQRRITIGNLMQKHFFDIWNGSVMKSIETIFLKGIDVIIHVKAVTLTVKCKVLDMQKSGIKFIIFNLYY